MQLLAKSVLSLSIALFSIHAEAAWDLNDVSILMPLPRTEAEGSRLHHATTKSTDGLGLIPKSVYEEIIESYEPESQARIREFYPRWTAIAYRIDPCFREHLNNPCAKQIRVSWQPVRGTTTENASLHTFYPISDEEWPRAIRAFQEIRSLSPASTSGLPLGVHPGLASAGLSSGYAEEVLRRLKPWIEQSRIQVIAMALPHANGEMGFKRFADFGPTAKIRLFPMWITYSNELEIRYANGAENGENTRVFREKRAGSQQWPSVEDTLRDFLTDSEKFRADRASLVRVADVQRRITDPTKHASLSIDCLSCHATGAVGGYVGRELTSREQAERKEPEFKNPGSYDLSNMSVRPGSPIRFRAFGYEGREVGILDRVIFESALVAEALKRAP